MKTRPLSWLSQENVTLMNHFPEKYIDNLVFYHYNENDGQKKCINCTPKFTIGIVLPYPSLVKELQKDLIHSWDFDLSTLTFAHKHYPARAYAFSFYELDKMRGYQYNLAIFPYFNEINETGLNRLQDVIYNTNCCLRLGENPSIIVSVSGKKDV